MQAKVEPMPQGVPNVLKQLIWDPVPTTDAQPVNATEAALAQLIDDKHRVRSVNCVPKFLQVLQKAKTEADEALVLVILRATATASDVKLSAACTAGFEKCGGLKIAKKWLNEAVEWNYSDLLVLLLDVLKVLPVQLTSITEARINEPIVTLRKTAQEEKVKRAAQDLLKHWRGRFTEKEKEKTKAASTTASSTSTSESATKPAPKTSTATTATPPAVTAAAVAPPKKSTDTGAKESKALKRRPIKWLDQAPSTTAAGSNAPASKSSELIGNLMQRKSAKEAASAKAAKDPSSDNKESTSSESSSKQVSPESSTQKPKKEEMVMQLPAIQSFKVAATTSVSKKIRWADEEGKDLVKVKLIESWRDMIHHSPHDENSFKDAKLREHEAERQAMKNHKDREAFHVVMAHEWTTPALMKMPEALSARRDPVRTEEVEAQSVRTRREMEFLVLDGEVPPVSPKEWTRTNEPHRGAPKEIPLLDVDAAAAAAAAPVTSAPYGEPPETDEERALRESLGPLQRSTIALLMENEHVLPMVYEEAQRNGNCIPDGRVVEIVDFHRRQAPPHQYHLNQPPPRGFNAQPPPSSQAYDGGYNKYGGGGGYNNGPPVVGGGGPGGYDYGRQYGPPGAQQPPPMHHQSLKRKAPGGILADAPPNKRGSKRGTLQCMYFASPAGCRHGNNCQYAHEGGPGGPGGPPGPHMGMPVDYGNAYGPPPGGRFGGHQPPMGMRGGGGVRGMRGGR